MAPRAPRPGTTSNSPTNRPKRRGWRVTIRDQYWDLNFADLGAEDDYLVRRQVGVPLSVFLGGGDFGIDTIAVIVWMSRRKAGEKRLNLQRVFDELPTKAEFDELAENDEFSLDRLEDIDDDEPDPGVIDVAGEEVLPDPLPSAEA